MKKVIILFEDMCSLPTFFEQLKKIVQLEGISYIEVDTRQMVTYEEKIENV